MKPLIYFLQLSIFITGLGLAGCVPVEDASNITPAQTQALADFTQNKTVVDLHEPVTFTSQSQNAAALHWDFGNGKFSDSSQATTTFAAPGTYQVNLTAYDAQNRPHQVSKQVFVGERFIKGFTLSNLSFTGPAGLPWDADGGGPDVLITFDVVSQPEQYRRNELVGYNFQPAFLPFTKQYTFTNVNNGGTFFRRMPYLIKILEMGPVGTPHRTIAEWTVNPYEQRFKQSEDKGSFTLTSGQNELTFYFELK